MSTNETQLAPAVTEEDNTAFSRREPPMMMMPPQMSYYQPQPEGLSPGKAAALLSIGSAVGLTAAAAYRWLNGGDFELIPPPEAARTAERFRLEQQDRQVSNEDQRLSTSLKSLVESLQSHTQQNERIVQRLANIKESRLTSDSVDRLRNQEKNVVTNTSIYLKLAEIQAELSSIRRDVVVLKVKDTDGDQTSWEDRLSSTIGRLDKCLVDLDPAEASAPGLTRSVLPVETPATSASSLETMSFGEADLLSSFETLVRQNPPLEVRKSAQVLYLFVMNLSMQPSASRYRKIFTSNSSYQTIAKATGAIDILKAVGFVEREEGKYLEWSPDDDESTDERYRMELKKAAIGLGILKTPSTRPPDELFGVVKGAMAAEDGNQSTPVRSNQSSVPPQTPEVGSIISPPMTRKQPYIAAATDLARLMETPKPNKDVSPTQMFQTPVNSSDALNQADDSSSSSSSSSGRDSSSHFPDLSSVSSDDDVGAEEGEEAAAS